MLWCWVKVGSLRAARGLRYSPTVLESPQFLGSFMGWGWIHSPEDGHQSMWHCRWSNLCDCSTLVDQPLINHCHLPIVVNSQKCFLQLHCWHIRTWWSNAGSPTGVLSSFCWFCLLIHLTSLYWTLVSLEVTSVWYVTFIEISLMWNIGIEGMLHKNGASREC